MIRLLEVPKKKIPVILVLRQTYGLTLGEANQIVTSPPQDLPKLKSWEEEKLRKALEDAGCSLEKEYCAQDYKHVSFYPPKDYTGPVCGSMYAFTTMCGESLNAFFPEPPRIHSDLSEEKRAALIADVDCVKCLDSLRTWGYLEGKSS